VTANPFAATALRPSALTPDVAADFASAHFGVRGEVAELGSQQDQNFRVGSHVLKVANAAWATEEIELQDAAMRHAAARLPGNVPEPASRGIVEVEYDGAPLRLRLLPYLRGVPLRTQAHLPDRTLRAAGGLAGSVSGALADFAHPAAQRTLQWDIRRAGDVVAAYAPTVGDPARRSLVERAVAQAQADLPRQVIHGDVSVWNVLADSDPSSRLVPRRIIDFGDCVDTWRAAECAVLAASVCAHEPERALPAACAVVAGFHAVNPLEPEELAAMHALIAARAAISAVSGEHQARLDPDNVYVADSLAIAWRGLAAVMAIPSSLAHVAFRLACGLPVVSPPGAPACAAPWPAPVRVADLSAGSDAFVAGAWKRADGIAAVLSGTGPILGRWGERRLTGEQGPSLDEPATVHLAADLFVTEGSPVHAPVSARAAFCAPGTVALSLDAQTTLWLRDVEPAVEAGQSLAPGDVVAHIGSAGALPPHVSAQLAPAELGEPPLDVPATLAAPWLVVCPDPGPLLGIVATAAPEPETTAVRERRARHVASPQRLYYPEAPPHIERGWRQWLYDVNARPLLDLVNNVAIVGHSHPAIEAAAARQLRLLNTNSRFLYDAMGRFAERLAGLLPDPLDTVFLVSSGSEANDLALRLARAVTGREDALCFEGCYHGWTGAMHETLELSSRMHKLMRPTADPEQASQALASALGTVGQRAAGAFICEPYLGNSGGVALPHGFLGQLYGEVRRGGGLCIADEVQVGYGRLGHYFWAFEQQGVVPDIVTIAKATGNGHPVAAVITSRTIADAFGRNEDLFASVGGAPVSCEVGIAVLDVLRDERLQARARNMGEQVTARLGPLVERYELVHALHGMGLYRGLELRRPDGRAAGPEALAACDRLLELGVIVQPTGAEKNILKLKPPLCVESSDIDLLAAALDDAFGRGW